MFCNKSMICTVNTNAVSVTAGGLVPIGSVVRRFGNGLRAGTYGVSVYDSGYYFVTANITLSPVAANAITATINENGNPITGGTATVTPTGAGELTQITIANIPVRVMCGTTDAINVSLSADAKVNNITFAVVKA